METTVTPPPRFTTRVGASEPGHGWAWPLTVVLHGLAAAAVVIVPLLGEELAAPRERFRGPGLLRGAGPRAGAPPRRLHLRQRSARRRRA